MRKESKSKNVLVTGCAGFIGSNLSRDLIARGYHVTGIDNLSYGLEENIPAGVRFHREDVRDRSAHSLYKGIDTVFHLAAKNCISDCQNDPVETADINVTGTVNVFEACRKAGVKKVIYAESSAMYEGSTVFPTPETEVKPRSFYALSKTGSMLFAEGYQRFFGLKMTALRYFCVYGPVQDYRRTIPPVMSAFIIRLLKGQKPVIYGDGTKRRDFVYVDDVNRFHMLSMEDPGTDNRVFNIGSGVSYSVKDIFAVIEGVLKTGLTPVYEKDLPGEAQETLADIREAKKMGWEPQVPLEDGIRRSIDYIRREVIEKGIV